jgi:hypothetical protein
MPEDLSSILETASQSTSKPPSSTHAPTTEAREVQSLTRRYKDAYNVARVIVGIGSFIKGTGIVLAILIALGGFIAASQTRIDTQKMLLGLGGVLLGGLVGVCFYVGGVLTSAQGQILKASLDGAVNGSPFLSNEHRARIMSL